MLLTLHRLGTWTFTVVALLVLSRVLRVTSTAGNAETIHALPCLRADGR